MDCEVGENVEHKTLSPQSLQEMKNKVKAGYIAGIKDSNIAIYLIPDGLGKVMRGAGKQVIKLYNYYTDIPLASDEEIKKIGFDGIVLKCNPSIMYQYLNDHNFAEYTKALHTQEAEDKQVGKTIETSFKGIASANQVKAETKGEKNLLLS